LDASAAAARYTLHPAHAAPHAIRILPPCMYRMAAAAPLYARPSNSRESRAPSAPSTCSAASTRPVSSQTIYLRFGVGFADGRKATNLDPRRDLGEIPAPDPPTVRLVRWEGYDRLAWEVDVWIWGLPPPGPLAFVVEWPARGIPAARAQVDAGLVLAAPPRAAPIGPAHPPR